MDANSISFGIESLDNSFEPVSLKLRNKMIARLLFLTPKDENAKDSLKIVYPGTELLIKRVNNEGYNVVVKQYGIDQGESKDLKMEKEMQLSRENVLHLQLYADEFLRSTFRLESKE